MVARLAHPRYRSIYLEWLIIFVAITLYGRVTLLDFNPRQLQQTGEHNESATLPLLAEIGLSRYGEIPLWNPYMLTGFPHAGDLINHFWNPVATVPVMVWGGINGMKVSIYLSLLVAAYGQWLLAHVFGVRGLFRLWAALLFGLSGGLALLWHLGWYELLVGAAWFPWAFALFWRALHRADWRSTVLAALPIALILTTGGGYYPFYLAVSLGVLAVVSLVQRGRDRRLQVRRVLVIAALGLGLSALYLAPTIDGYRMTARDASPDVVQANAQRIPYALFNYVVQDTEWFRVEALNKASGASWFYIGALPLLALFFTPWVYAREPRRRRPIIALGLLILALLVWHANPYTPVRFLYEQFPFLYTFRFPNRLLILIASPLLVLAALSLQGIYGWARERWGGLRLVLGQDGGETGQRAFPVWPLLWGLAAAILLLSVARVYDVNKGFGMVPNNRDANAGRVLDWLRAEDPELYYTNIGGSAIYWAWMPFAYEREMPVINFRYNRRVRSMDDQLAEGSPFSAQPRYVIAANDQPALPNAELVRTFDTINVWRRADALPFAFAVAAGAAITPDGVAAQPVELDGPNHVVVEGTAAGGEQLVVLVSDYPGWRLEVDGRPAAIEAVNGYLGATMEPGDHTYRFSFRPSQHTIGLVVTLLALAACVGLVVVEWRRGRRAAAIVEPDAPPDIQSPVPEPAAALTTGGEAAG
jgi:hypothetical protein